MREKEIQSMLRKYGSPLYIFDDEGFIKNFNHLCESFRKYYPNYFPGYSFKTNYTPHICKIVKSLGGYAEIVSDMELQIALKTGFPHNKIIYNGPSKRSYLEQHLLNGGITNIDNQAEAIRIATIAKRYPEKEFKIGLRVNTDIGAGFISRFGVDINSNDYSTIKSIFKDCNNIKLCGLHLHISRARYLKAWENRITKLLEIADNVINGTPEYIDLGSGMFGDIEESLKKQFTIDIPSYEEYASVVAGAMASHYRDSEKKPILFTEPGTTVVSKYLSLLTQVTAIKDLGPKKIAILDCDIHLAGETCLMMKLPYTLYKTGEGPLSGQPVDLTGFTCLEQDVLYKNFQESVKIGDIIEFRNVGGYSIVYKPPFIQPCCAMIAKTSNGIQIIKRKETTEDIIRTFSFE